MAAIIGLKKSLRLKLREHSKYFIFLGLLKCLLLCSDMLSIYRVCVVLVLSRIASEVPNLSLKLTK
jgi:hypothetical protein